MKYKTVNQYKSFGSIKVVKTSSIDEEYDKEIARLNESRRLMANFQREREMSVRLAKKKRGGELR